MGMIPKWRCCGRLYLVEEAYRLHVELEHGTFSYNRYSVIKINGIVVDCMLNCNIRAYNNFTTELKKVTKIVEEFHKEMM